MNPKQDRALADKFFRREVHSFENFPHQSLLFTDFQANSTNVIDFYPEKNTSLENFAERVLSNYKIDRNALCDILSESNAAYGANRQTLENIELLRKADCLTIVTGQQAGLFSGPLYTIYKAISAIKLAADLRKQHLKAVPIFWIAEEDHDFDEVKKTFFLDKEGRLKKSENEPRNYVENLSVGFVKLDETINETIANFFGHLPSTEFTNEIKVIIAGTYESDETYSTAFARLLTKLFTHYGLIVLSPLNEEIKKLCAPLFAEAVEKSDEINAALLDRNNLLEKAHYQPQVLVAKDSFPFFFQNENGERKGLRKNLENSKLKIQNSKLEFDKARLIKIAQHSPQNLSPNALMRPVVQDYLLPTLVYFGGAAEIAYFAQNSAIYKILNRPVTPIRHRASFSIVPSSQRRTLEKYKLNFEDLFDGSEKILSKIVEQFVNTKTAQIFDETEDIINTQLNRLDQNLKYDDSTLSANLDNRRKKIQWHIRALRKKYHRAELLKNEIIERRIENLYAALLPNDALQERTLNVVTFLNLYGVNFIDWIYETTDTNEENHQVLYL